LGLSNPVDFIYHVQPLMLLTLLPFSLGFEGKAVATSKFAFGFTSYSVLLHTLTVVLFGGLLAFVMEILEYFIVRKASSLTLSIVGITKEIFTIAVDVAINGSQLSFINVLGACVCLTGIGLHIARKAMSAENAGQAGEGESVGARRRRRRPRSEVDEFSLPLLSSSESGSNDEEELFVPSTSAGGVRRSASATGDLKGGAYKHMDDNFLLRDQRQWTSVRDSHLK